MLDEINRTRIGKILVFTNGVFDILHVGHVTYLQQAKELGDILVVGVNSDQSARKLGKGSDRPIHNLKDRTTMLMALRSVNFVLAFEEDTPVEIIKLLQPDIHVKGGDYNPDSMPETQVVRSYGGKVVILPFVPGHSTTSILKKLAED